MGQRYCKMEDQKPWPGFSRNQEFAEKRGLQPKFKISELGDALSKLVLLKRFTNGALKAEPHTKPPEAKGVWRRSSHRWAIYCIFLKKKSILMPLNHILHVFWAIWKN